MIIARRGARQAMSEGNGEWSSLAEARSWPLDATGGAYVFREEATAPSAKDIPSMELINQTLL